MPSCQIEKETFALAGFARMQGRRIKIVGRRIARGSVSDDLSLDKKCAGPANSSGCDAAGGECRNGVTL